MAKSLLKSLMLLAGFAAASLTVDAQCAKVSNITFNDVSATTANVSWNASSDYFKYEYLISMNNPPSSSNPGTMTSNVGVALQGLQSGVTYYFCVRGYCTSGSTISEWNCGELKMPDVSSVNTVSNYDNFSVVAYPNPTTSQVRISLPERYNAKGHLIVTNLMGAVVYSKNVDSRFTDVPMSHLATGMYLVKYSDANVTRTVKVNKL